MKKLILILFFMLLIPTTFAAGTCATYRDVPEDIWYCPMLTYLQEQNILDSSKTEFNPNVNLNRAEALKVLFEASGERQGVYTSALFDLDATAWFTPYFQSAYAMKYIQSYKGEINPGTDISKAEFIYLFTRIFEVEMGNSGACGLGVPKLSGWISDTPGDMHKYLCKAKMLLDIETFDEPVINRATAMAVLYKALKN